jgi:Peptidase family M28
MAIDSGSGGRRRGRPAEARRGARAAAPRAQTLVNWSLYRIGWVVVLLPALIVLVGAHTPRTLPSAALPETFDGGSALSYTAGLVTTAPDRAPGSAGDARAASWIADQFRLAGMAKVRIDTFRGRDADDHSIAMQNVIAIEPGTSRQAMLLIAHHDAQSPGPSANDNGSGVGMLIELARTLVGTTAGKTVILASTDGALAGSAGARHLASEIPSDYQVGAVIAIDAVGRDGPLRIRMDSDTVRQPAAGLVTGLRSILLSHGLVDVRIPSLGRQAAGLLAPLGIGEQAPFIGRGIAAVTLDGSRPNTSSGLDQLTGMSASRMGKVGNAVQALVLAYEAGPAFESPASSYLLSSDRVIRGWTLQLLLLALVVPAVLPLLDLVARGTRRGIPLAAALRDLARRLAAPLVALAVLRFAGLIGAVPDLHAPPFPGDTAGVSLWVPGLALAASAVTWRLARRPAAQADARDPAAAGVAGYLAALFGALVAAGLALLGNPYALVLALPALHLWLVLPSLARLGLVARLSIVGLGWIGPALLIVALAGPVSLGGSAPLWAVRLLSVGALPLGVVLSLAMLFAATSQLVAIVSGRYASDSTSTTSPAGASSPPAGTSASPSASAARPS